MVRAEYLSANQQPIEQACTPWWWVSFSTRAGPLGAANVQARSGTAALARCRALGIHPQVGGYLPFLVSFLSFFSFVVSLGLFVFAVRFLFLSLGMDQEYPAIAREARPQGSSAG